MIMGAGVTQVDRALAKSSVRQSGAVYERRVEKPNAEFQLYMYGFCIEGRGGLCKSM
jgi:hypothetical protein